MSEIHGEGLEKLKKGAAKGGAAARGDKKRRKMTGTAPGKGTAGRANALGKRVVAPVSASFFPDVAAACGKWLREHGLQGGGFREEMLASIHAAKAKR